MKILKLFAASAWLYAQPSGADAYILEGTSKDGLVIVFETVPPTVVSTYRKQKSAPSTEHAAYPDTYRKRKNGFTTEHTIYTDEGCELSDIPHEKAQKAATFSCPATGTSPLAGTTYVFRKHVGKDCTKERVFDLYVCVSGCNGKRAPKTLKGSGSCC